MALIGIADGLVFLLQGRPVPALAAVAVLGLIAWVVSPAAFPRTRSPVNGLDQQPSATVYWRPGCVYCLRLRWSLGRLARRAAWIDIWTNEDAAAFVRGVNDGNETVPTVVVGDTVRTNPEVGWVRRALLEN